MPDQVDWRSMEQNTSPGRAVGRLLRDQRLSRDLTVDAVAARLRIRTRYIEAIEQGRFDQLPGAAYIPAFLRGYANYLGLDADKVLTAYQLSGPVPISRPVSLPAAAFPIVEKRPPIGLAVLTALLVFSAGYAAWHYLPRQQTVVSQRVPPVPDRLLATPAPDVPPSQAAVQPSAPPAQEARLPTAPPVAASPAANPAEMWPAPKTDAVKPETVMIPAAAPVPAATPVAPPAPGIVTAPPPPAPLMLPTPSAGQAQAAQAPLEQARPTPAVPAPVTQESVVRPTPDQANTPAIAPPARTDTRVVARSNSWIELRGPAGDILAQTYVRAGESYVIPAGISYRMIDAR